MIDGYIEQDSHFLEFLDDKATQPFSNFTIDGFVSAQSFFPVEATVNLLRPSVYPEDVSAPGAATVTLRLTDNRPDYEGYLILQLADRAGRTVTSRNDRSTPPIVFSPGRRVVVLTGNILQPWVQQLTEQAGLDGGNGVLQKGRIDLRAWLIDANFTDEVVSNQGGSSNFAELHEPPTPTQPVGPQTANAVSLLNFRWLANHVGSSPIRYTLRVYELPDIWAGSPDVVLSTFPTVAPPVVVPGVNLTSYFWLNAVTPLAAGKTYLYTVQAEDVTGRLRFRNNGVSPHRIFTYEEPVSVLDQLCYVPQNPFVNQGDQLLWAGENFADVRYTVTVRERPDDRFVSLTELDPTPDFPERTALGGGPRVRYSYDLPTPLDTAGGRAFTVELCALCPNTGEQNCVPTTRPSATYGPPPPTPSPSAPPAATSPFATP